MFTPTEDSRPGLSPTVPMPRMRAVVTFSDVVEVTVRPGVRTCKFLMSVTPASCSCCAETAITAMGTSCRFCSRFCAVTMISLKPGWVGVSAAQPGPARTPLDIDAAPATYRSNHPNFFELIQYPTLRVQAMAFPSPRFSLRVMLHRRRQDIGCGRQQCRMSRKAHA